MRNWKKPLSILLVILVLLFVGLAVHSNSKPSANGNKIQVVAGENFWGNLVSQVGGTHVKVTSIVSDPNADPHEYEATNTDARSVANANYVVLNGAGYDSWGDKLLAANPSSSRRVLHVADLVGKKDGDNPHLWYSPDYVNTMVDRVAYDLETLDPADKTYFETQLKKTHDSLAGYQNQITAIKQQYGGTKVAATEDIFVYLANAAGLNLISPPAFIEAVAEGNDPPAQSIAQFQQQLQSGEAKVLVYNLQTVTPLTDNVKKMAADNNIPIVGVTETLTPLGASFQAWMGAEVAALQNALNSASR
ncbi:MAG TPA: zinc ABC transporter substrate-binding protein [Candidatus Binatia bacterium]|nr:zinc ABC transporter substrate-binding protein [Candidatus Binatia bacterium]